ncbi:MAG TPA: hypothetical protein VFS11_04260 [Gemmatimonadales bacterium]|nr:hypothetical protein [Gemmatimonadales bacterium]
MPPPPAAPPIKFPVPTIRSPSHLGPVHWLLAGIAIIPLDYFTGPYLDALVLLYPVPAAMAAWTGERRWSIALATLLPLVRMVIFQSWGWPATVPMQACDTSVLAAACIAIALFIFYLRQQALKLRVLEGMLPICGFCKRIRSGDSWEPLEKFIGSHSEATFSHTFCPDCGSRFYGDLVN